MSDRTLKRRVVREGLRFDNGLTNPLDYYFVNFINDTLREIRKGLTAYVFKLEHIEELHKFEPKMQYEIIDDIFHVWL